jgi:alkylhydroperoxidase family enzyme
MLRKSNIVGGPRIGPLEPPYDDDTAAALEQLGPPIALFRLFARRPARARGIHGWGRYYLSRRSALTFRQRELIIDRTTALCGAEYEWGIHIATFADRAGLTPPQLRSLTAGTPDDPCWTDPGDRAVLHAVDALHTRSDLTDPEWHALISATGPEGAIDLMLLCGWYHAISYVTRATRLTPEPGAPSVADIIGSDS